MSTTKRIYEIDSTRKAAMLCLKITFVIGTFFAVFYKQTSIEGILLSYAITAMYAFGLGFGNGYLNKFLSTKWDWVTQTNQRIWAGVIGTIIYTIVVVLVIDYVQLVIINDIDSSKFFSSNAKWMHLFNIVLSLGVAAFVHARDFMINWKASVKQESTEQKIIAGTASAQFDALKNQLDPHFLFNSLNVLTSLIDENPDAAQNFTTSLSKVYRYVLEQKSKELVTVDEELQFARTYVRLLKMRFEDSIVFDIPDKASNPMAKVVPLSLQLLLENAVKHNVVNASRPLHIKIFEREGNLIVENNLQPKEVVKKSSGVGLVNIKQRYNLLTQRQVQINKTASNFSVEIPMLTKQISVMQTQTDYIEDKRYERAKERVQKLKEFYSNLYSYVIVIPILAYINYRTTSFPWAIFPALGWGFGVVAHWYEANGRQPFLGKGWEEKKIRELMQEDEQRFKNYE